MKNSLFLLLLLLMAIPTIAQEKWGNVDKNTITLKEIAPIWPGCENSDTSKTDACFSEKLKNHIKKNFKYPPNAWKNNIQERIVIDFVINTKGEVEITKAEGKNQELIQEAKRNINAIPTMKPGMLGGKPNAISYSVPFNFKTGK